jgi:hypothetical protein
MAPHQAPPRHVLRGILRHIKTPRPAEGDILQKTMVASPTTASTTTKNASQLFLLDRYRVSDAVPQQQQQQQQQWHQLASDYLALQRDLKERGRLYELDAGAEVQLSPKEMSRRSAARAGLQMPVMDPPDFNQS